MKQRHKHADVIHAWAEGEEIEFRHGTDWAPLRVEHPVWHGGISYRIKPKRVKKEGWVNVYRDSFNEERFYLAATKEQADEWASENRLACIRIEWEETV